MDKSLSEKLSTTEGKDCFFPSCFLKIQTKERQELAVNKTAVLLKDFKITFGPFVPGMGGSSVKLAMDIRYRKINICVGSC